MPPKRDDKTPEKEEQEKKSPKARRNLFGTTPGNLICLVYQDIYVNFLNFTC